jgi:uncharacterized protein YqgV (UPF0045/DUF77 family)
MITLTAQVSVYPLRQPQLSPTIDKTVRICRAHGLEVSLGSMSTLVKGDDDEVFAALKQALRSGAAQGDVVMVVTLSNACPAVGQADAAAQAQSADRPDTLLR